MQSVTFFIRYSLAVLCLLFFTSSFALSAGDILSEIQKRVPDERLLKETKEFIRDGDIHEKTILEKAQIFSQLEEIAVYYKRRQRPLPPVTQYILDQKETILKTLDARLESSLEIYTLDRYARFKIAKKYEDSFRAVRHEEAKLLLPKDAVIPTPKSSDTFQSILIDLSEQRIYAYEEGILIGVSPVTTGKRWFSTIKGDFTVEKKQTNKRLVSPFDDPELYYTLHVDYWIQFQKTWFGIHDSCNSKNCWRTEFWGADYTWRGSHGCVNTPYDFVKWLYDWSLIGTRVSVIA